MKYIANPVEVDAYKILEVQQNSEGYLLKLENGRDEQANLGMTARMAPTVGDYWVIQADGYVYLNPKDVFLRKYHPA